MAAHARLSLQSCAADLVEYHSSNEAASPVAVRPFSFNGGIRDAPRTEDPARTTYELEEHMASSDETKWGPCISCRWWQIEPEAKVEHLTGETASRSHFSPFNSASRAIAAAISMLRGSQRERRDPVTNRPQRFPRDSLSRQALLFNSEQRSRRSTLRSLAIQPASSAHHGELINFVIPSITRTT